MKTEFKRENGKASLSAGLDLDLDKDAKPSITAKIIIEGDEAELTDEAAKEILAKIKLPEWLESILGIKK
jgi:hypothetical protein